MNDGIGGLYEGVVFVVGQAKLLVGEVAQENARASRNSVAEFGKLHVQLKRLPETFAGFLLIPRADQEIQRIAITAKQSRGEVAPEVSG
jgi:hypothetical protein